MGLAQQVATVYNQMVGGSGVLITRYPTTATGGVAVAVTASGVAAYKYVAANANVVQIVAKAIITVPWRIVWCQVSAPNANSIYVIKAARGSAAGNNVTAILGEFQFDATVAKWAPQINIPYAATVVPDGLTDALLADAASSSGAADTAAVAFGVMTGMGN